MKNADSNEEDDGSQYADSDMMKSEDDDDRYSDTIAAQKSRNTRTCAKNPREFFARKLQRRQEQELERFHQNKASSGPSTAAKLRFAEEFKNTMNELIDIPLSTATAGFIPVNEEDPAANSTNHKQLRLIKRSARMCSGNSPDALASREQCRRDARDLTEAVYCFGYNAMKPQDNSWRFKEMQSTLMPFQLAASKWMLERECTPDLPLGGILAYATGLGKSIISLACVLGNRPNKEDLKTFAPTTLVVVPNHEDAVKWQKEIQKHCNSEWYADTMLYDPAGQVPLELFHARKILSVICHGHRADRFPYARILAEYMWTNEH